MAPSGAVNIMAKTEIISTLFAKEWMSSVEFRDLAKSNAIGPRAAFNRDKKEERNKVEYLNYANSFPFYLYCFILT